MLLRAMHNVAGMTIVVYFGKLLALTCWQHCQELKL